jgi:hypothetical protein
MPGVDSSAMWRISYDDTRHELAVTFKTGKTYTYFEVPEDVYEDFLSAPSKGRFFNERIRDRYRFA